MSMKTRLFTRRKGLVLVVMVVMGVVSLGVQHVRVMRSHPSDAGQRVSMKTSHPNNSGQHVRPLTPSSHLQDAYPVGKAAETSLPVMPTQALNPITRGEELKHQCETSQKIPGVKQMETHNRLLIYKPLNLTMCYVPKAGCTYWKRVFISLRAARDGEIKDVLQVKKQVAHVSGIDTLSGIGNSTESSKYLTNSNRFIFIRDPYARLFSVYIDKFYLADLWSQYGIELVNQIRGNITSKLNCGHDLSFTEFLQMVNDKVLSVGFGCEHWLPISTLCDPCLFNYQYVGTVETFDDDRSFILQRLGLDKYVSPNIRTPQLEIQSFNKSTSIGTDLFNNACQKSNA